MICVPITIFTVNYGWKINRNMTASDNLPITTKQPSDELLNLIEDLKGNLIKTKDLFVIVVNKARDEGFQDKEIDTLLHSNMKEIIPKTTLLRYRKEFIPLGVNKRSSNMQNVTLMNDLEQSSIISGPFGPTDNKILPLPDEINQVYQNGNLTNITTSYETKDAETTEEKDFGLSLPHTDSYSLKSNTQQQQLESAIKYSSYPSEDKAKNIEINTTIIISPDLEHFCSPYTQCRYGGGEYGLKLFRFMNIWIEMKKLYNEMVELQLKCGVFDPDNITDAIIFIEEDFKAFKFRLSDTLLEYIAKYFIDKKTKEYLVKRYGNEKNHYLGFEKWERDLNMSPKHRKLETQLETQMIIEESREATKKYLEERLRKEDKESESTGMEDLT